MSQVSAEPTGKSVSIPAGLACARRGLRAVGLIAAHGVSGVSSATARLTELGPAHHPWRVMAVGPGADNPGLPGSASPGFMGVAWDDATPPVEQVRRIRDALRACGADVVNPNFLLPGFVAAALDHHRGRRIGAIWHGSEWAAEDLYERASPLADAWRAVSPAIASRVEKLLGIAPGPDRVLGAAVAVPNVVTPPPMCLGRDRPLRLFYAAWLDERSKRVMDLPVLADALAALGVNFHLTIAGRGPAAKRLADALAPHGARFSMPGPIPLDQMPSAHREHDVLLLVSANEGSPVTVMEAMSLGRPAAITRGCGGALEAVRDGVEGFVVDVGDMKGLAAKLAGLSRDPTRLARMSVSAHLAAKARFDLSAVAPRYDDLVEEASRAPGISTDDVGPFWSRLLAVLEMIGPNRPTELAGLCAEWLADLGSREVWLHWTPDAPELLDAISRFAPTLIRGIIDETRCTSRLGWPILSPAAALRGSIILSSGPAALAPAAAGATILPLTDPQMGGLASRRLDLAIQKLRHFGSKSIALYGAGKHTRRLGRWIAQYPEIAAILDDRAGQPGGPAARLWGLPVVKPDQIEALGIDGVIVSSDEFERVMLTRARRWGGPAIVGMYEGLPGF